MLDTNIRISKRITVGPSINNEKLEKLASKGFKTIINLSKKGEIRQVVKPCEEEEIVNELGLKYIHHPLSMSSLKDVHIDEFCRLVKEAEGPIFVHCSLGQRSFPLAMIAHALNKKLSAAQVFEKAEKLGVSWNAPFMRKLVEVYLHRNTAAATS